MANSIDERLKELLSLRPNDGPRDKESCLALGRSYLELETLWMKALGIPINAYPCVDLAEELGQGDLPQPIEQAFRQSRFSQSTAESRACRSYLRWLCLKEDNPNAIRNIGLDDPFVPLLELFEAGAQFSPEGWFFDILYCGGINARALRQRVWENAN